MPQIKRFEDLSVWRAARRLTRAIYRISRKGEFSRDFGLKDQVCKSSISIMSNVAEGFERNSNREFVRFLVIAKGSTGELRSQLYIALDQAYVDQDTFKVLSDQVLEISRMLGGFIKYLKKSGSTKPLPGV